MSKINILSPYFINVSATGLQTAQLDVYIYTGTQTTGSTIATPTYTLSSTAINNEVTFEISELVKDYFSLDYNPASPQTEILWVDYIVTKTISGSTSADPIQRLKAFYGYGYFSEGANPSNTQAALINQAYILKLDSDALFIPVDTSLATEVKFYNNNTLIDTETISTSTSSTGQIAYATNSSGNTTINKAIVYQGASTTTINVESVSECVHTPYKLTFINKLGALQHVYFFKRSARSLSYDEETYGANIITSGSYSTRAHKNKVLYKNAKETLSLSSGYYPEATNSLFEELLISERVWINYEGDTLPVVIETSNFTIKTSVNDKLINYQIEVAFANEKINNIK